MWFESHFAYRECEHDALGRQDDARTKLHKHLANSPLHQQPGRGHDDFQELGRKHPIEREEQDQRLKAMHRDKREGCDLNTREQQRMTLRGHELLHLVDPPLL